MTVFSICFWYNRSCTNCRIKRKKCKKLFEQMKGLSPKKKIEYYIQYYGIITLIVVGILVAVISFIVGRVTEKERVAGIMLINSYGEGSENEEQYLGELLEKFGIDSDENTIEIGSGIYVSENTDEMMKTASIQKIVGLASSGCIDVVFSDEEYFPTAEEDGMCADLTEYLDEAVLQEHEDDLYYCKDPETGKEIVAGIKVSKDNELMKKLNWYTEDPIVSIMYRTERPELAVEIVNAFLE